MKLIEIFRQQQENASPTQIAFIESLESTIADDLWKSAGGHWSLASQQFFREKSLRHLALASDAQETAESLNLKWTEIVRDFHQNYWGEKRLPKAEKKVLTDEQKISRELFSYILLLLQTTLVTKTLVLYFGLHSSDSTESSLTFWLILTACFSLSSMSYFIYRQHRKGSS